MKTGQVLGRHDKMAVHKTNIYNSTKQAEQQDVTDIQNKLFLWVIILIFPFFVFFQWLLRLDTVNVSYTPHWPQVVRSLIGRRGADVPARAALATRPVTVITWNRLTTSGAIRSWPRLRHAQISHHAIQVMLACKLFIYMSPKIKSLCQLLFSHYLHDVD